MSEADKYWTASKPKEDTKEQLKEDKSFGKLKLELSHAKDYINELEKDNKSLRNVHQHDLEQITNLANQTSGLLNEISLKDSQLKASMNSNTELNANLEQLDKELQNEKASYEKKISLLGRDSEDLKTTYENEISEVKSSYEKKISELQTSFDSELSILRKKLEDRPFKDRIVKETVTEWKTLEVSSWRHFKEDVRVAWRDGIFALIGIIALVSVLCYIGYSERFLLFQLVKGLLKRV